MSSNYPPEVTGNEFEIAGPDYEKELEESCDDCGETAVVELGYRGDRWAEYTACGWMMDLPRWEPDPDRAYDEARERRLFGDDWKEVD